MCLTFAGYSRARYPYKSILNYDCDLAGKDYLKKGVHFEYGAIGESFPLNKKPIVTIFQVRLPVAINFIMTQTINDDN